MWMEIREDITPADLVLVIKWIIVSTIVDGFGRL